MEMTASQILAASKVIMQAFDRGAIGSRSAVRWARRALAGEDLSSLKILTGGLVPENAIPAVRAHSNQQVLQTLTAVLSGGTADPGSQLDPQYAALFPPQYSHEEEPSRQLVYQDGKLIAPNGAPKALPYASRFDGRPGTLGDLGDLDDETADTLFPPDGMTGAMAAQAAHVAWADAAA